MKFRPLLIFALVLSLAVVPGLQLAFAQSTTSSSSTTSTTTTTTTTLPPPKTPYAEKLSIYTAGYNDFFLISMSPVSSNTSALAGIESTSGVTAYQVTAIKSTAATASSILFWGDGYKVVKVPFVPDDGVFINITASSQSAAQSAASGFESLLGTNLNQIGSSGNNYTYFGTMNFETAEDALFPLVPTSEGGLASLFTLDTLLTQPFPTMILSGVLSGSSFTHTIAIGSTESHILDANGTLNLDLATNLSGQTFTAAVNSTSTILAVHSLDGLISTPDKNATMSNDEANFSSSYSVSVTRGANIKPNVTITSDPPVLSATRTVASGSTASGDIVTVTVNLANTASANTTALNIALNDNWYTAYPSLFSLSAGNSTIDVTGLAGGQNVSRVYTLKVTGSASEDLIVPSTTVTYQYDVGNLTLNASTKTNQLELRANDPGPAMEVTAGASIPSGSPLGTAGNYVLTVTNTGDSPALDLKLGNATDSTLLAGATWTVDVNIAMGSIVNRNTTQTFTLGWTAPDGSQGNVSSNPFTLILSHSGVLLPLMQFTLNLPSTPTVQPGVTGLNITYNLFNAGNANSNSVTVSQTLAAGITCNSVTGISNGTATCSGSTITVTAPKGVEPAKTFTGTLQLTFSNDSYVTLPAVITTQDSGVTLHMEGAAFILPAGVIATKVYVTNPVFDGQSDNVLVSVKNLGTTPVYDVVSSSVADIFASTTAGNTTAHYDVLAPGASEVNNFTIQLISAGKQEGGALSVSYDLGGFSQLYSPARIYLEVYKPVFAQIATKPPVPEAGKDFTLDVNVQNPSPANVTNVAISFVVPQGLKIVNYSSGLKLSGRTFTFTIPSLSGEGASSTSVTLLAATSGTTALPSGTLSFVYQGATVSGTLASSSLTVGIDLLLHFELPIAVAVLIAIAAAFYIHRKLPGPQTK